MEIEDPEYNILLAEKRHKELLTAMKNIVVAINSIDSDDSVSIADIASENSRLAEFLMRYVNEIKISDLSVKKYIEDIASKIVISNKEVINAIKNKPLVSSFSVNRDINGNINTIDVKYK